MKRLIKRQELFAIGIAEGLSATQAAIRAGYSERTAKQQGYQLSQVQAVIERVSHLTELATSKVVMPIKERKERLTVIAREDIANDKGTQLRQSNITAIVELNKMDRLYDIPVQSQDNRTINIFVGSDEAKRLTERVANRLIEDTKK